MTTNRRYSPRTHAIVGHDPTSLIGDPPTLKMCINEQWIPHLLGALEVMSVDDYWEDPAITVPQVENLMASLSLAAPEPCLECPDFVMDYDLSVTDTTFHYFETLSSAFCTEAFPDVVWGYARPSVPNGISKCAFKFRKGTSPVGIRVKEMACMTPEGLIGTTWSFEWTDCLGGPYVDVHPGIQHLKSNWQVKTWELACTDAFMFVLSLAPGIECGVA